MTKRTKDEDVKQREQTVDTGLPVGEPQDPAPEESEFLPNTGASTPNPPQWNPQDTMDEARDGFMKRYPSSEEDH